MGWSLSDDYHGKGTREAENLTKTMLSFFVAGSSALNGPIKATPQQPRAALSGVAMAAAERGALNAKMVGIGACAPDTRVSNLQLEAIVETSDEWIKQRTGIGTQPSNVPLNQSSIPAKQAAFSYPPALSCVRCLLFYLPGSRHLLAPGEGLSDIAATAAQRALESAGVDASDVEIVILATSSPDDLFGDAACVARTVGATGAVAFDLTGECPLRHAPRRPAPRHCRLSSQVPICDFPRAVLPPPA